MCTSRTLRQKLGDAGSYIQTIRGIGYKNRRDSMTKKIFRTILAVGMAVLLLSMFLFCSVLMQHFTGRVFQELETEAGPGRPGRLPQRPGLLRKS